LEQRKSGIMWQVTSKKRFNSYEMFCNRKRKRWPFNTGDCMGRFDYVIGLRQVCDFIQTLVHTLDRFPAHIKLTIMIQLKYCKRYLINTHKKMIYKYTYHNCSDVNNATLVALFVLFTRVSVMVFNATFNNISVIL
jgi:hypothetical protein